MYLLKTSFFYFDQFCGGVRVPNKQERKVMVANTVAMGVRTVMSNHVYKFGEETFLQTEGCPIGLDLSQGVARAVMMLYDRLYLEKVKDEGMDMRMYARYIDDSNQIIATDETDE